jgi:uncharacterized protein
VEQATPANHQPRDKPVEWPASLDLLELRRSGWRPTPFRQFVLKLHSRCNLACRYCYVYTLADQSWRDQPLRMSRATLVATAERIAEHARDYHLPRVDVVLHGGEPLLAGGEFLAYAITTLRRSVPAGTDVSIRIQTNGLLLTEPTVRDLARAGVRVGVSLDGGSERHNRHRVRGNGGGSYAQVAASLRLLASPAYRSAFAGLLSVVDVANDPVEVYESLAAFDPPVIDFLLPHGNWTHRPPGRGDDEAATPYADWLVAIFDRWYESPRPGPEIRLFQQIAGLLFGLPSTVETVGLAPSTLLVVETDGAIEQVDALKSTYDGAAATGLNVRRDPIARALDHPGLVARQIGTRALGPECQACSLRDVCGGGYYPHRYQAGTGFRNRSVYCPDLYALIRHIQARLTADVARGTRTA